MYLGAARQLWWPRGAPLCWRAAACWCAARGAAVPQRRWLAAGPRPARTRRFRSNSTLLYFASVGVLMVGVTYAAVPLYQMFCQATGIGGAAKIGHDSSNRIASMRSDPNRLIKVSFNADLASNMRWNFRPIQRELKVHPGETALAFFTAKNSTDQPVVGVSTYNVLPYQAGQYFMKIQCFCFDEQILNPGEQVDLPVFFYIDPDFVNDPDLDNCDNVVLSYTFFEAKEGLQIPLPGFMQQPASTSAH